MKTIKLDPYEQKIDKALEKAAKAGAIRSTLTPQLQREIRAAAGRSPKITGKKERRFNVRLSADDLIRLQARAEEAGLPYQTLASVILHQAAIGKLELRVVKT